MKYGPIEEECHVGEIYTEVVSAMCMKYGPIKEGCYMKYGPLKGECLVGRCAPKGRVHSYDTSTYVLVSVRIGLDQAL